MNFVGKNGFLKLEGAFGGIALEGGGVLGVVCEGFETAGSSEVERGISGGCDGTGAEVGEVEGGVGISFGKVVGDFAEAGAETPSVRKNVGFGGAECVSSEV